jgi:hypothetical protein
MAHQAKYPHDLIFGAKVHDPAYWRSHPMVAEIEAQFDGPYGWVGIILEQDSAADTSRVSARPTTPQATRDDPDLYFYGEGECPLSLFEGAPRVRELRVSLEGPVEGDDRNCWSVGIWLSEPMH